MSGEPNPTADAVMAKRAVAPYRAPQGKQVEPGTAQISVAANSEVAGDKILLGEIATIEGDAKLCKQLDTLEIGDSPVFGVTRGLDRLSVETRLVQAGYKPTSVTLNMPVGAKLHRKAQTIPSDQFVQAAMSAAESKMPGATFKCDQQSLDFSAPMGKVDLTVENCAVNRTSTTVTVAVLVDGKRINARNVILKPDGPSQRVTAGQAVKIVLRSGGAVVEVNGKSRNGGFMGQAVTVVADTGSVLTGTVVGSDRVEVKM